MNNAITRILDGRYAPADRMPTFAVPGLLALRPGQEIISPEGRRAVIWRQIEAGTVKGNAGLARQFSAVPVTEGLDVVDFRNAEPADASEAVGEAGHAVASAGTAASFNAARDAKETSAVYVDPQKAK